LLPGKLHRRPKATPTPIHPQWVIELDSSTPEKFSRHLIVRAPGWAFADNIAAGAFVSMLLSRPEAQESLFVAKPLPPGAPHPAQPLPAPAPPGLGAAAAVAPSGACGAPAAQVSAPSAPDAPAQAGGGSGGAGSAAGAATAAAAAPAAADQRVCAVDRAVYTRNRHFRLWWSSKGGKAAVLRLTDRFANSPEAR
jgi:hypothetical protein